MFELYGHLIDVYTQVKWKSFGYEKTPIRNSLGKAAMVHGSSDMLWSYVSI